MFGSIRVNRTAGPRSSVTSKKMRGNALRYTSDSGIRHVFQLVQASQISEQKLVPRMIYRSIVEKALQSTRYGSQHVLK
jgi:hypothetical protein